MVGLRFLFRIHSEKRQEFLQSVATLLPPDLPYDFHQLLLHAGLGVIGILDFYHAAQYLATGAKAAFDGRTQRCQATFIRWRHHLRHGRQRRLSAELQALLASPSLPKTAR